MTNAQQPHVACCMMLPLTEQTSAPEQFAESCAAAMNDWRSFDGHPAYSVGTKLLLAITTNGDNRFVMSDAMTTQATRIRDELANAPPGTPVTPECVEAALYFIGLVMVSMAAIGIDKGRQALAEEARKASGVD